MSDAYKYMPRDVVRVHFRIENEDLLLRFKKNREKELFRTWLDEIGYDQYEEWLKKYEVIKWV